jgi:hypothetical protein
MELFVQPVIPAQEGAMTKLYVQLASMRKREQHPTMIQVLVHCVQQTPTQLVLPQVKHLFLRVLFALQVMQGLLQIRAH